MDSSKVQALWQALDEMAEKSPDQYQKFIDEQMKEAEQHFGNMRKAMGFPENTRDLGNSSNNKTSSPTPLQKSEPCFSKQFSNLYVSKKDNKKDNDDDAKGDSVKKETSLTDDIFKPSSLLVVEDKECHEEEKAEPRLLLSTDNNSKGKKPLIEEL